MSLVSKILAPKIEIMGAITNYYLIAVRANITHLHERSRKQRRRKRLQAVSSNFT